MSDPWDILQAFATQLGAIAIASGYETDIGTKVVLYDQQRGSSVRPSIAIGSRAGLIDLRKQAGVTGAAHSRFARQMDFMLDAGMTASSADAQRVGHAARRDIERVYEAMLKNPAAMPSGVSGISLTSWSILDRPDGIDAVVLQIIGVVDYMRTPT